MPPTERTFDRSDLILAWLAQTQYRNAHEDLRVYHDAANVAFGRAFGINVYLPPDNDTTADDEGFYGFLLKSRAPTSRRVRHFPAICPGTD